MRPISIFQLTSVVSLPLAGILIAGETPQSADVTNSVPAVVADLNPAPTLTTEQVHAAIEQLRSPVFVDRQQALEKLKSADNEQIAMLADAVQNHPDNEVTRRCVELLERRYAAGDRDSMVVRQASEALEAAINSDRWFVAEAARDSLKRHWKRRVEIAILELQKIGIPMSPKDPTRLWDNSNDYAGPLNRLSPASDSHLKIFVDEYWKTEPRSFELLQRLSSLVSHDFMTGASRVSVVVIDGHPLAQEQIAELKGIFGDTRVSERGRVCLGIVNGLANGSRHGVEVSDVASGSSAAKARIEKGDVLLKFEGKLLNDFDDLVNALKAYRPDDEVTFEVLRYEVRKPFDVKVKLQGWYER